MSLRSTLCLAATAFALAAGEGRAIEMFTFFGDGSRIGLPSLEVPVEAYPGIPLRSDRIRMRRRGARSATTVARSGRTATAGTITLREAPVPEAPEPPEVAKKDTP